MSTIRKPTRAQLSRAFDQQTVLAFEALFDAFNEGLVQTLSSSTADSTAIANTAAATNFSQTYNIKASTLSVGKTIRFSARALYSTTGSPTFRLRVLLGTTAILDTGTGQALQSGGTNCGMSIVGELTCRTGGATGTVVGGMSVTNGSGVAGVNASTAAAVTVNTTADKALTLEWTWSAASASNTIKLVQFIVEAMN